jgi:hypothetical protein
MLVINFGQLKARSNPADTMHGILALRFCPFYYVPSPFFIFSPNSRKGMLGSFNLLASSPPNLSVFLNSLMSAAKVFFSRCTTLSLFPKPVLWALAGATTTGILEAAKKTVATALPQNARRLLLLLLLLVGVVTGDAKPSTDSIIIMAHDENKVTSAMMTVDRQLDREVWQDILRLFSYPFCFVLIDGDRQNPRGEARCEPCFVIEDRASSK